MRKAAVFKGCTRPAMFMGVPYVPFIVGTGACLLGAMYIDLYFLLALPAVVFAMRMIAKVDEHIFHLLGLNVLMRLRVRNLALHQGKWVFSPVGIRRVGMPRR